MVRDNEARGPIYREVTAAPAYHEFEEEHVVLVRATFEVPGLTQHQPLPLSIEAATKLYQQLREALSSIPISEQPSYLGEIAAAVTRTVENMERAKETFSFPPAHNCSMLRSRLEERLTALEDRLQNTLEVNELWDGS
ncbi:hypothetical protein SAMN05216275_10525 [Streptosporangium canum]|uniref:Uncharacterized protein n=1 Tax=Streptosporangium canum TaxID=324952 RepID=A0A1I3L5Y5_9ACTN|nr:hypothetical protein [Streptosporangium canum]SFI80151.1 hypothetical protein SAMN05216275_10525 [Streptosporangium canum]